MKSWGPDARPLVSLEEAWKEITHHVQPLGHERVRLEDSPGRILAKSIAAGEDYPPFDRAMMDGYAVRSADCSAAWTKLRVVGQVTAGGKATRSIERNEAVRINTGAELPLGADAVVAVERTGAAEEEAIVVIHEAVRAEQNVARRGSHRPRGATLVSAPCRIGAAQIAAIASAGYAEVTVAPMPSVAIVSTGDELALPGEVRGDGQVFESNSATLTTLAREWGACPRTMGIVRDEREALRAAMADALHYPLTMTIGGMSMGTRDLVPAVMRELGVEWRFHGVDMRPGKPTAYGVGPKGQHVLGLPGNPVSAFVCAALFARPIVWGMQGLEVRPPRCMAARLDVAMPAAKDSRPAYLPAVVRVDESAVLRVRPVRWGGSADVFGLAEANALMVRRTPSLPATQDSLVDVLLLTQID